jgi:WD40 repeat protein
MALAEGFLKALFVARLRTAVVVLLAVAVLALGGGLGAYQQARMASSAPAEPRAEEMRNPVDQPAGAVDQGDRSGAVPLRLNGPPLGVAFAPDGARLASCGGLPDATLRLWEANTGREIWCRNLGCAARVVAFSVDGGLLAVGCDDRTVRVCDPETGKEIRRLDGHEEPISALVFTPDDKSLISASLDGTVRVWDRASGKEARRFTAAGCALRSLALSRDGTLLAAGAEEVPEALRCRVLLWELPSGKERPPVRYYPGGVAALAFAPNGRTLAAGGMAGFPFLCDLTGEKPFGEEIDPARNWHDFPSPIAALAFTADGRALTFGCNDGTVYICDLPSGRLRQRLVNRAIAAHYPEGKGIVSLAFTPDGHTLATGGSDRMIRLWEMSSGKQRSFER